MREQLGISDYDRLASFQDFCFGYCFEDYFRTDARRITHGDADSRPAVDGLIGLRGLIVHQPNCDVAVR
jgi:hypothetical protein